MLGRGAGKIAAGAEGERGKAEGGKEGARCRLAMRDSATAVFPTINGDKRIPAAFVGICWRTPKNGNTTSDESRY